MNLILNARPSPCRCIWPSIVGSSVTGWRRCQAWSPNWPATSSLTSPAAEINGGRRARGRKGGPRPPHPDHPGHSVEPAQLLRNDQTGGHTRDAGPRHRRHPDRVAGRRGRRTHDHGDEHHPRRRVHLEQPAHRIRGLPGADLGVPDHAAVLLRRRRRLRRHLASGRQLGQLADAPLHPAVPAGVLLPGVLGRPRWRYCATSCPSTSTNRSPGSRIQLLWFLGAYVLVLAAVPLLARITTTGRLIAAVAGTYAFIAVVDAIRINVDGLSGLGYLNLVAWLIPGMLGVAYRRRLLAGRAALALGAVMFAVNLALMWLGPYELSLVGIETQQLKNMTPPSLLLAGHAIMMCAFAIAAAPAIARWARRPAGVVADRDRQLRRDDAVPVAHPGAAGHAPGVRLSRPSALRPERSRLHRAQRPAAGHHGHPGCRRCSSRCARWRTTRCRCGTAATWPRPATQRRGRRAAVRGRCGHAGIGRLGPQRPGAVLRRGDAGGAGRRPVPGHRPARRAQRVCAASLPASTR